jgi:hypothetical protein
MVERGARFVVAFGTLLLLGMRLERVEVLGSAVRLLSLVNGPARLVGRIVVALMVNLLLRVLPIAQVDGVRLTTGGDRYLLLLCSVSQHVSTTRSMLASTVVRESKPTNFAVCSRRSGAAGCSVSSARS